MIKLLTQVGKASLHSFLRRRLLENLAAIFSRSDQDANRQLENKPFLIDGLNVAYWCGNPPSLRLPVSLVKGLRADGHCVLCVFDASSPHRFVKDYAAYEALILTDSCFCEVPAGQPADRELIKRARADNGVIISRDHFSNYRRKFRKLIDDPTRRISGFVDDDQIHLPSLGWSASLLPTPT